MITSCGKSQKKTAKVLEKCKYDKIIRIDGILDLADCRVEY